MSLFIESIKIYKKKTWNLERHSVRLNRTRRELLNCIDLINLEKVIEIPENLTSSIYKCRVLYSEVIHNIEFIPYKKKDIKSLKIIHQNSIDYTYKYADRKEINSLYKQKKDCDDILIIKDNKVTDTSYCNIAFFDGLNWFTPKPLLEGTMRTTLMKNEIILEKEIHLEEIFNYEKARVFNALIGWEGENDIEIDNIIK